MGGENGRWGGGGGRIAAAVERPGGNICEPSEEWRRVVERITELISLVARGPPIAFFFFVKSLNLFV